MARLHGETVPLDLLPWGEGLLGFWVRKPIGVVVGIAGFNYPLLLAAHKIAPALAAGCPVIAKPAPQTPLATLWLVHVLREALAAVGAPRAAVQLVTGGVEVGVALTTDRRLGAVSFTGSAAVGHRIAKDAAPTKVLLELGSNAALVVAADADLDAAADAVVRGGYYASGQACISVQRVLVVESVREQLRGPRDGADGRGRRRRPARCDDPGVGPHRHRSTERVREWVGEAVAAGATLVPAATPPGVEPAVLLDVPDGELVGRGGLRPGRRRALGARSRDGRRRGQRLALRTARQRLHPRLDTAFAAVDRIEAGGVVVNEVPGFRSDVMPYGGVKDSGAGREGRGSPSRS